MATQGLRENDKVKGKIEVNAKGFKVTAIEPPIITTLGLLIRPHV